MYILQYVLILVEKERRGDYKLSPESHVKLLCISGYLSQVYHRIIWLLLITKNNQKLKNIIIGIFRHMVFR